MGVHEGSERWHEGFLEREKLRGAQVHCMEKSKIREKQEKGSLVLTYYSHITFLIFYHFSRPFKKYFESGFLERESPSTHENLFQEKFKREWA